MKFWLKFHYLMQQLTLSFGGFAPKPPDVGLGLRTNWNETEVFRTANFRAGMIMGFPQNLIKTLLSTWEDVPLTEATSVEGGDVQILWCRCARFG